MMHPDDRPKYTLQGFKDGSRPEDGYDAENEADTLAEARAKAKYMMSEEYQRIIESSNPIERVKVLNRKGECVEDFWG